MTKRLLYIIFLFFSLIGDTYSQPPLQITGKFIVDKGNLENAEISIVKDFKPFSTIYPERAKFSFNLEYNSNYLIVFSKNGYISKKVAIDTHAPEEVIPDGFAPYIFDVTLFKEYEGVNTLVFDKPIGKITYDDQKEDFVYDGHEITFKDNKFDLVFSIGVLHHLHHWRNMIKQMVKCSSTFTIFNIRLTNEGTLDDVAKYYQKVTFDDK